MKATIGRIVIYRTDGRNKLEYDLPAIITCTLDSHPGDYPDGSHNPLPVPESDEHVHLTVFTPGGFGTTVEGRDPTDTREFVGANRIKPGSGSYVEWNVPMYEPEVVPDVRLSDGNDKPDAAIAIPLRSWRWPVMVK